jgi:putative transposase
MEERGVEVEPSTINRWGSRYSPPLAEAFHWRKRSVWVSWRMEETYIQVQREWKDRYRAVDTYGQPIDLLLTEHRDKEAALRFLKQAIRRHDLPKKIPVDGSEAHEAALTSYNEAYGPPSSIRQVQYFTTIVEQEHRSVKRVTRPMWGFKAFEAAQDTLVGIELMHMIKKQQRMVEAGDAGLTAAEQFDALAA